MNWQMTTAIYLYACVCPQIILLIALNWSGMNSSFFALGNTCQLQRKKHSLFFPT